MISPDGMKWLNERDDLYHGTGGGARRVEGSKKQKTDLQKTPGAVAAKNI